MLNICYFILQLHVYVGDADRNILAVTADILYGFYARNTVKMCSLAFFQFNLITVIKSNTESVSQTKRHCLSQPYMEVNNLDLIWL